MSSFLHDSLLDLVLKYGILSVRSELESICKSLYEDLSSLYGEEAKKEKKVETRGRKKKIETSDPPQDEEEQVQVQIQESPQPQPQPPPQQEEQPLKRRIVKKSEKVNILVQKLEENGGIDEEDKQLLVVEEKVDTSSDPKEIQRLAVEAKHDELLANGIDPESLLTKENLEKWLKAGKSYQKIAREHIGLHESIVSAKAKEFGFQSLASKYKFIRKK